MAAGESQPGHEYRLQSGLVVEIDDAAAIGFEWKSKSKSKSNKRWPRGALKIRQAPAAVGVAATRERRSVKRNESWK